jgi:hypothetical protein
VGVLYLVTWCVAISDCKKFGISRVEFEPPLGTPLRRVGFAVLILCMHIKKLTKSGIGQLPDPGR